MNRGKILSGFVALAIYLSIIFIMLFFYNIHKTKAKNYVEKNSDRVTVTLVNSNKTVFNKSAKKTISKNPVTIPKIIPHIKKPIVKKHTPKKVIPKKIKRATKPIPKNKIVKKVTPKKVTPKKAKKVIPKLPKKKIVKKVIPKKVTPKKAKKVIPKSPKKKIVKKVIPKKVTPKKAKKIIPKPPKKKIVKKVIPKKVTPKKAKKVIPKPPKKKIVKKVPKKTAKDLFSSVKTKQPVKKRPKHTPQPTITHSRPAKQPSSIKHNMSITDKIKSTHQSGRISNANRDKGIENAYISRVKRHMNNWNPVGMKGQWVTVNLTIYNSGKFRYTTSGVSGSMRTSLKQYLDTLNRMGLGRHKKSTPYSIQVRFRVH